MDEPALVCRGNVPAEKRVKVKSMVEKDHIRNVEIDQVQMEQCRSYHESAIVAVSFAKALFANHCEFANHDPNPLASTFGYAATRFPKPLE